MVNQASEDLTRTQINLYTSDIEFLRIKLGFGWTTQIRELVREYTLSLQAELNQQAKP